MTDDRLTIPSLSSTPPLSLTCPWCRRLLPLCNGQRTVQDIATILQLPIQVVLKLVHRAATQGWLQLPQETEPFSSEKPSACYRALQGELNILFGEKSNELLGQAVKMARVTPEQLDARHISDVLIALELRLPREQAETFGPQFDALRDAYAS